MRGVLAVAAPGAVDFRLNLVHCDLPHPSAARYHRRMKMPRLVFIATCLFVLAACGNKGPLVLPQKPVPVPAEDPLPPPAEPVDTAPTEVPAPPEDDGDGTPR